MSGQWVVVVNQTFYGPTEDEDTAREFAAYLTAEVDPAAVYKLHSPTRELLAYYKNFMRTRAKYPPEWPPKPGEIWQDRAGNRWACAATPSSTNSYLVCLARPADDSAEEIWRTHGPLRRVYTISPTEEECPF